MLTINREQFRKIYAGLAILEDEELFFSRPVDQHELLTRYLPSKLWRMNNCYKIVDKLGNKITFRMNMAQHRVYAASLRHPRLIILKSRQQGISTFWLVAFFDDAITRHNYSIGLMAQGQDEAATLLERTKILWDELDVNLKTYLGVYTTSDNTKEFALNNGSKIFVRTSFRSTTLQRLHISEMGKIANKFPEKAKETKTGTLQAIAPGNIVAIESTAEGDNLFKTDYDNASQIPFEELTGRDFLAVFLSWVEDPDCVEPRYQEPNAKQLKYFADIEKLLGITLTQEQRNFWITKYRELGDSIYQEYPTTPEEAFLATKTGTYYAHLFIEFIRKFKREMDTTVTPLFDKNLDVQLAVDLGMNDTNVIVAFQEYMDEIRIIDEIYDNGQQISYYTDIIKKRPWFDNLTHLILPHDAEVKELTSGKTRVEVFQEELKGVDITVLPRLGLLDGIEAVRNAIKMMWIAKTCSYITKCLLGYRKEWDEKLEKFRDKPLHDEHSNGADAVRYMVLGLRKGRYIRDLRGNKPKIKSDSFQV